MLSDSVAAVAPCFLFEDDRFKQNIESFIASFEESLPKFTLAYSTKTNPHWQVLKALRENGKAHIEIVSPHEYSLARAAGFDDSEIVYNGVIPDVEGKFRVAEHGGIVNAENVQEIKDLSRMAAHRRKKIQVGIRLNLNVGQKYESRFGIKPESPEFNECFEWTHEYFDIVGIHAHLHGNRWLEGWEARAVALGRIAKEIGARYIDFGSNMFGYMDPRLADQFGNPIPSPEDYARTIRKVLSGYFEEIPEVIIEAGTPVVANAMTMVGVIENISGSHATASCSAYDLGFFRGSDKHPPVDIIHRNADSSKMLSHGVIYGYACTEDDVVCHDYSGGIARGDIVLVRNIGAYALSLSSDFIKQKPAVYPVSLFLVKTT